MITREWKSIETAPRNGAAIIVGREHLVPQSVRWMVSVEKGAPDGAWFIGGYNGTRLTWNPTHWTDLPRFDLSLVEHDWQWYDRNLRATGYTDLANRMLAEFKPDRLHAARVTFTGDPCERCNGTGEVEGYGGNSIYCGLCAGSGNKAHFPDAFEDLLPLTPVRVAPGEYEIKSRDGRTLWRMEGAALADWVCASVNGYDGAIRALRVSDDDDNRAGVKS